MSLTLALQQIQLPTWWTFEAKNAGRTPQTFPLVIERRAVIVAHLEAATGRVTTDDLIELTKATRSQVTKTLGDLFNAGLVEKGTVKVGCNKHSTWRMVK